MKSGSVSSDTLDPYPANSFRQGKNAGRSAADCRVARTSSHAGRWALRLPMQPRSSPSWLRVSVTKVAPRSAKARVFRCWRGRASPRASAMALHGPGPAARGRGRQWWAWLVVRKGDARRSRQPVAVAGGVAELRRSSRWGRRWWRQAASSRPLIALAPPGLLAVEGGVELADPWAMVALSRNWARR